MSDKIEELKRQLRECKERADELQRDIRLLIKYRPKYRPVQILRNSQRVGDATFNQNIALRSQDFVKRHVLKRK